MIAYPCKICGGQEEFVIFKPHPETGLKIPYTQWCICKKSKYISERHPLLSGLANQYFERKDCYKFMQVNVNKGFLEDDPNYLITSTDYDTFLLNVKFLFMHFFNYEAYKVQVLTATDIVKKYYLDYDEKRLLTDLNRPELLVIICGSQTVNTAVPACLSQVLTNRTQLKRPSWLYIPDGTALENSAEFSTELKLVVMKHFKLVSFGGGSGNIAKIATAANQSAGNFTVASRGKSK